MEQPTDGQLATIAAETYSVSTYEIVGDGDIRAIIRTLPGGWVVVAFRGTTKNGFDIVRDIRFFPWWNHRTGFCPAGFLKGVMDVIDEIILTVGQAAKQGKLILIGHSLGGAMALIAAAWFVALNCIPAAVVVFEPARPGWFKLWRLIEKIPRVTWYQNGNDRVPRLPPVYLLRKRFMVQVGTPTWDWLRRHRIADVIANMKAAGIN